MPRFCIILIFWAHPIICSQNQNQLQLLINTKFSRLQVWNTCIARRNSKYWYPIPLFTVSLCYLTLQWLQIETIVVFLFIRSCNWFWQFNFPHWLREHMIGRAQKIKMMQNLGIDTRVLNFWRHFSCTVLTNQYITNDVFL